MKTLKVLAALAAALMLYSCPQPITRDILLQAKDGVAPMVTILTPADGSYCAKIVVVSGKAEDASSAAGDNGKVRSARFEVLSSSVSGDVDLGDDGSFTFQFSTVSLGSNFVLKVTAEDWNGNTGDASITLLQKAGDNIPSFSVQPGNHQVTLTWSQVPVPATYTVYYTTNGALPSPTFGTTLAGVSSPLVIPGLRNGSQHVFLLLARTADGQENWSDYARTIPLSPQTLAPRITPGSGQMTVAWQPIDGTNQFEVWRSPTRDGGYILFDSGITGTQYVDRQADSADGYYYKIRPVMPGCAESFPNQGIPVPFPANANLRSVSIYNADKVAASPGYAYVVANLDVKIYDVSTPSSPSLVNTILKDDTGATCAFSVTLSGNYAYVVGNALRIYDVTNPATAGLVKTLPMLGARSAAVSGDYAYVSCADPFNYGTGSLQIVDITTPASASVVKTVAAGTWPCDIAVSNGYAYMTDGNGLRVIDVSPVSDASIVQTLSMTAAMGVDASGTYAYVCDGGGQALRIIDITTPESAHVENSVPTDYLQDVAVSNGVAYVADYIKGLRMVDVSNPAAAATIKTVPTYEALGVAVSGDTVYIADGQSGLEIIDARTPIHAEEISSLPFGWAQQVAVSGDYAYVTGSGVQVVDIHNPSAPSPVTTVTGYSTYGLDVSGDYVYAAASNMGLLIVDISIPTSPSLAQRVEISGVNDVQTAGDYAYVACASGLQVVDISSPGSATVVRTVPTSRTISVAVSGTYAYVGSDNGLQVVDISYPQSASIARTVATGTLAGLVAVYGRYAYLSTSAGLQIYDISSPANPTLVGTVSGVAVGVCRAVGSYLYVTGTSGLVILDVSTPAQAAIFKTINFSGVAYGVSVSGRYAYLTNVSSLKVVDLLPED